jgi:hypothetical protein
MDTVAVSVPAFEGRFAATPFVAGSAKRAAAYRVKDVVTLCEDPATSVAVAVTVCLPGLKADSLTGAW